jgi:hypothetical protein
MNIVLFGLSLLGAMPFGDSPADAPEVASGRGQLIMAHLASAPFPHPQRAKGHEYQGQFFSAEEHYADNSVAIFIPAGFRESGQIASILDRGGLRGHIKEVWLFDALYAKADSFLAWLDQRHGRMVVLYTEHGGTREETEKLMANLKRQGLPYFAGKADDATPTELRQPKPIFLFSELEHDSVLQGRRAFYQLLNTSILDGH